MNDIIEVQSIESLAQQAVLVAQLVKLLDTEKKRLARQLEAAMSKGDRKTARDPRDETKLGTVSLSDPDAKVTVVDDDAFETWLLATYPDDIEQHAKLGPIEEVAPVLHEHAPHLLEFVPLIPEWVYAKGKAAALISDTPGTRRDRLPGVLSIRPNAAAEKLVREVLAAAPIPLLELEAGE